MNNNKKKTNMRFTDIDACGIYIQTKMENLMQKMIFSKKKSLL